MIGDKEGANTCFFRAGIRIDKWIYYSSIDRNCLYRANYDTGVLEILGIFPQWLVHVKCGRIGEELWFLPENGNFFDVYNMTNGKIYRKEIDVPYRVNENNRRFSAFIKSNEKVYITPGAYPYIIVVNSKGDIEEYIPIPAQYLTESEGDNHTHFYDAVLENSWIYLCPDANGYMVRVNIKTKEVQGLKWNEEKHVYGRIVIYNDTFYMVPVWKRAAFIKVKKDFNGYEKLGAEMDFGNSIYTQYCGRTVDNLWFFGIDTNKIIQFSLKEFRIIAEYKEKSSISAYRGYIEDNNELIISGKEKGEALGWIRDEKLFYRALCEGTEGEIGYLIYCLNEQQQRKTNA